MLQPRGPTLSCLLPRNRALARSLSLNRHFHQRRIVQQANRHDEMESSITDALVMVSGNEPPDYMNEHVFCRNRLPPRAYFLPAETLLLSGRWRFHYASSPMEPEPSSHKAGAWSMIDVPGHW